jgi:hypothetical protein
MAGRHTKLTPERQKNICDALRLGLPKTTSVEKLGIRFQTYLNWIEAGEAALNGELNEDGEPVKDKIYADFYLATMQAEAQAEAQYATVLAKAAIGIDEITTRTTTRTLYEIETTKQYHEGKLVGVTTRKVPKQYTDVDITKTNTVDWRAAESWLKRQRRRGWGDNQDVTSDGEAVKAYIGVNLEDV